MSNPLRCKIAYMLQLTTTSNFLRDSSTRSGPRHRLEVRRPKAQTFKEPKKKIYIGCVYSMTSCYGGIYSKMYKKSLQPLKSSSTSLSLEFCSLPNRNCSFSTEMTKMPLRELTRIQFSTAIFHYLFFCSTAFMVNLLLFPFTTVILNQTSVDLMCSVWNLNIVVINIR